MGDNIRLAVIDAYAKRRHPNVDIISVGDTITNLNSEPRDNTTVIYLNLKSSYFIDRVEKKVRR